MVNSWHIIKIVMTVLILLDGGVLCFTFFLKQTSRLGYEKKERFNGIVRRSVLLNRLVEADDLVERDYVDYLLAWYRVNQSIRISTEILDEIQKFILSRGIEDDIDSLLKSRSYRKRADGLKLTGFLEEKKKKALLQGVLNHEPTLILRLKTVQLLCDSDDFEAIELIRDSMKSAGENYKKRILAMLEDNNMLLQWTDAHRSRQDSDTVRILIRAARTKRREWYFSFLTGMTHSEDREVAREAANALIDVYGSEKILRDLIQSEDREIRRKATYTLYRNIEEIDCAETAGLLRKDDLYESIVEGLTERLREKPRCVPALFYLYRTSETVPERTAYASILSSKIEYFILRLSGGNDSEIGTLLGDVISLGYSSPVINFLNSNKDLTLESRLLRWITPFLETDENFLHQCQYYLKDELKTRLTIPPLSEVPDVPKIQLNRRDRINMLVLLLFVIALPLGVFLLREGKSLLFMTGEEIAVSFVLMYHGIFAIYTLSVNSIYLFLLFQSWIAVREQITAWNSADKRFLYAPGLLPSVSILAPAYNEEKSIVQNVYSLLSLDYPHLEVIVINDGSSDKTMERLIKRFDLKLADLSLSREIRTAPVIGVYKNDRIPNLTVIDKINSGKADALNVGLNAAGGEYICSIDADSLLETDALTKLMFRLLSSNRKTIAIGGNIIPVNGCLTNNGSISEIHLSTNIYSRFQTIEYLRSFITGRLGWARMNSLMIISGAFGAFYRKDVIAIGGYMTGSGSLRKDTVGEDMELVVRLVRFLNDRGEKFHIDYSHNANCWTEVPEKLSDLLKQRDRWHRGLIEILIYHKRMIFNGKYGVPGLIAFPYLLIYELLGPFWELLGYLILFFSLIMGLVSGQIFFWMFSVVILLGILISSSALLLAERDILYFKGLEFSTGVATVIEENFGYRQLVSIHRVFAYVSYLFNNKGWQKLKRKGFTSVRSGGNDET